MPDSSPPTAPTAAEGDFMISCRQQKGPTRHPAEASGGGFSPILYGTRWLQQGQCGSSSLKTFMILKPRIQSSLERIWARWSSILCKPLLCLAGRGLLLFQTAFLRLLRVEITIGLDTGAFESRVAFIRFRFYPSLSRQRYDYCKMDDHEAEVPFEFTYRISKMF